MHLHHLKRGGNVDVFTRVFFISLSVVDLAQGLGMTAETEAAVKAPVIGRRLHRDQQMEGRGAASILKV